MNYSAVLLWPAAVRISDDDGLWYACAMHNRGSPMLSRHFWACQPASYQSFRRRNRFWICNSSVWEASPYVRASGADNNEWLRTCVCVCVRAKILISGTTFSDISCSFYNLNGRLIVDRTQYIIGLAFDSRRAFLLFVVVAVAVNSLLLSLDYYLINC